MATKYKILERCILFNKAFKIVNKGVNIKSTCTDILFILSENKTPLSATRIYYILMSSNIGSYQRAVVEKLALLESAGFIVRTVTGKNVKRYKYSITVAGINFLTRLEEKLRSTRFNAGKGL